MKYHFVRWGAYGDVIVLTPLIKYLKDNGHEIAVSVTERGEEILRHNPNVDKLIVTPDKTVSDTEIQGVWDKEKKEVGADVYVNFSESNEVSLLKFAGDPDYKLPKWERVKQGSVNIYEKSFRLAGIDPDTLTDEELNPKLYFSKKEINKVERFFDLYSGMSWNIEPKKKMIILWCLSGSGMQKAYPYTMSVMREMIHKYDNLFFLTAGDVACKLLEIDSEFDEADKVIMQSGEWGFRETMLATKYADMVVSPDTGILHASGAYDTPKIGLESFVNIEHATKHYKNNYSMEAEGVTCAPCFKMITMLNHCPLDFTGAPMCISAGFPPQRVINQIDMVIDKHYGGFKCNTQKQ